MAGAAPPHAPPAPKGKTGKKGKGKGGKAAAATGKGKGIPAQFQGKSLWCSHGKRICYDHHISSCQFAQTCAHCHDCCPEPGCTVACGGGSHGVWSH